ncbi:unnamed protein product [Dovyalis caffra]|uniref:Uncharacterized protein n=1 Tax=Dovyalis caffra TaxID=77055 RepID=A0AAV1RPQ5_9ROSI|nr:unnamed protein product [Dovyalis caffra]
MEIDDAKKVFGTMVFRGRGFKAMESGLVVLCKGGRKWLSTQTTPSEPFSDLEFNQILQIGGFKIMESGSWIKG